MTCRTALYIPQAMVRRGSSERRVQVTIFKVMETSPTPARAHTPFTYEDYCRLPDDGQRYELIDGEFYVTPAPTSMHQTVSRRLQHRLMLQLEDPGLAVVFDAPFDVILANTTVVQPDLCVIKTERKGMIAR